VEARREESGATGLGACRRMRVGDSRADSTDGSVAFWSGRNRRAGETTGADQEGAQRWDLLYLDKVDEPARAEAAVVVPEPDLPIDGSTSSTVRGVYSTLRTRTTSSAHAATKYPRATRRGPLRYVGYAAEPVPT
jgi:hypothetical protein